MRVMDLGCGAVARGAEHLVPTLWPEEDRRMPDRADLKATGPWVTEPFRRAWTALGAAMFALEAPLHGRTPEGLVCDYWARPDGGAWPVTVTRSNGRHLCAAVHLLELGPGRVGVWTRPWKGLDPAYRDRPAEVHRRALEGVRAALGGAADRLWLRRVTMSGTSGREADWGAGRGIWGPAVQRDARVLLAMATRGVMGARRPGENLVPMTDEDILAGWLRPDGWSVPIELRGKGIGVGWLEVRVEEPTLERPTEGAIVIVLGALWADHLEALERMAGGLEAALDASGEEAWRRLVRHLADERAMGAMPPAAPLARPATARRGPSRQEARAQLDLFG